MKRSTSFIDCVKNVLHGFEDSVLHVFNLLCATSLYYNNSDNNNNNNTQDDIYNAIVYGVKCSSTSSLELSADGPQTTELVIQPFQTVAEDVFYFECGTMCSVSRPAVLTSLSALFP